MTWSYSRIKTFEDCPYRFFMKYFYQVEDEPMFYASYGSFIHDIINKYYLGELNERELTTTFITGFSTNVQGERPAESTVKKYIDAGLDYFENFKPFECNTVAVEQHATWQWGKYKFQGYIDYIGEKDGDYFIIDHKSRELKPRSKRKKPTLKDQELDSMFVQLYTYAEYIKQRFGKYPKALYINAFRTKHLIEEEFSLEKFEEAKNWALETIETIKKTEGFYAYDNYFTCRYICGVNRECEYYQIGREQ